MDKSASIHKRGDPVHYGELPNLLGYQLRRAQMQVFQHFSHYVNERLVTSGATGENGDLAVTPGQAGLLILIQNNPGISQTALARAAGIERSTLGEVVERFRQRGLVDRAPSPTDKRSYALTLSTAGVTLVDALVPTLQAHEALVAGNLSIEEKALLIDLLSRLSGKNSE